MISPTRAAVAKLLTLALLAPFPLASAEGEGAIFHDDFEEGSAGWSASGLWSLSSRASASPSHGWHYATELADGASTYDTGARNWGELVSPVVDLSGAARASLSFWTKWEGEVSCSYEHPEVLVEDLDGARTLVWESCDAVGEGGYAADLTPFVGQGVRVVFRWDTRDGYDNAHEGWYVDDVRIAEEETPTIQPATDLAPSALGTTQPLSAGVDATVFASVRNKGAVAAGPFTVVFLLDGVRVSERSFLGQAGSSTLTANATVRMPAEGAHTLEVIVDANGTVAESNEANNARTLAIHVGPPILDLVAGPLRIEATQVAGFASVVPTTFSVVANRTRDPFFLVWELDGEAVDASFYGRDLATGTHAASVVLPPLAAGAHELVARLDAFDNVVERDETNNIAAVVFDVLPPSEVALEVLSLAPIAVEGGAPHPLGRHEAALRACNGSPTTSDAGNVTITIGGDVGNAILPGRPLPPIEGGACWDDSFQFDAHGVVGEFRLDARLELPRDGQDADDNASAVGHRLVDGPNGVVAPGGAREPLPVERSLSDLLASIGEVTAPVVADPPEFVWSTGESTMCQQAPLALACAATRGEPGMGQFQPCGAENDARANLPVWLVWYAVQVQEHRGLPPTERPPPALGSQGLPPQVDPPVEDSAPRVCEDHWATLRALA